MSDKQYLKKKHVLYTQQKGLCIYCGCCVKFEESQMDHIIPKRLNGSHDIKNRAICCSKCNQSKWENTLEEWLDMNNKKANDALIEFNYRASIVKNLIKIIRDR